MPYMITGGIPKWVEQPVGGSLPKRDGPPPAMTLPKPAAAAPAPAAPAQKDKAEEDAGK